MIKAQNENGQIVATAASLKQLAFVLSRRLVPAQGLRVGDAKLTRSDAFHTFLTTGCIFDGYKCVTLVRQ